MLNSDIKVIIDLIKKFKDSDYEKVFAYYSADDCIEIVRRNMSIGLKDIPKIIKIKDIENIYYFHTKQHGIIICYKMLINDRMFELYELTLNACNEYNL